MSLIECVRTVNSCPNWDFYGFADHSKNTKFIETNQLALENQTFFVSVLVTFAYHTT